MNCTHVYVAMATPGWRKCICCMSTMPPAAESIMLGGDRCRACMHRHEADRCHECGCPIFDDGRPDPVEPTTAEAFAEVREMLKFAYDDDEPAVIYLALLERRMQGSPPLATLVEGFCQEVENAKNSREARKGGGQTTGVVSPFEHVQPSVASNLERWARDFREALKT